MPGAQTFNQATGTWSAFTPATPVQQPTGGATNNADPSKAGQTGYDVFGNVAKSAQLPGLPPAIQTPAQQAKPITAFSSDQGATQAADNTAKLQTLKSTGLTLGPDGLARYSDASFASAPSDAMQNEDGTWQSGGVKYALGPATSTDPELQAMYDQINQMKTQFDATSRAGIDNIKNQFEQLIRQQTDVNTRSQASLDQSLLMGGSSRYAQQSSTGQSTTLMSYGLSQLADLNTKEQSAVISAQAAMDSGDMKLMDQQLTIAQQARQDKQSAAQKLSDQLTKANQDLQAKKQAVAQDTAIGSIISQGVTNPTDILKQMKAAGYVVTAKDISDSIANLNPEAKAITDIMTSASKNGATPDQLKAIGAARSVQDAIAAAGSSMVDPTSNAGQYQTYTQSTVAAGKTPLSYTKWNEANEATKSYNNAYNAKAGTNAADAKFAGSDKGQQQLEQQYRQVLLKEVSNRSGGIGLQDAKVNQAIHLKALIDSYKDTNGDYNIPTAQFKELTMGLATLLSPSGQTSDADRREIMSKTAAGDINGALQYVTGVPQNGNTQAIIKNLIDSIDRQGQVSEDLRNQDVQFLHGLAPTDLHSDRISALEKNTLASYRTPPTDPVAKATQDESLAASAIKAFDAQSPENQKMVDDLHAKYPNASATNIKAALNI